MKKKYPVLKGFLEGPIEKGRDNSGEYCGLKVWCPHCANFHYHGWYLKDGFQKKTHRASHCSHYDGYYIQPFPKRMQNQKLMTRVDKIKNKMEM